MRAMLSGALVSFAYVAAPHIEHYQGPLAIVFGVLLALFVAGHPSPLAMVAGAAGALALFAISHPFWGAGLLAAGAYLGRAARASSWGYAVFQTMFALVVGGAAGLLVASYGHSHLELRAVTWFMAAVLCALPFALRVDDPVAGYLRSYARQTSSPVRFRMLRALVLRRRVGAVHEHLPRNVEEALDATWWSLVDASRALTVAPITQRARLSRRVHEHVGALSRAYRAVESANVLSTGLEADGIEQARTQSEHFEAEVAALTEVLGT